MDVETVTCGKNKRCSNAGSIKACWHTDGSRCEKFAETANPESSAALNCYKRFEDIAKNCPSRANLKCSTSNDTANHQYGKCCVENCATYYWLQNMKSL